MSSVKTVRKAKTPKAAPGQARKAARDAAEQAAQHGPGCPVEAGGPTCTCGYGGTWGLPGTPSPV